MCFSPQRRAIFQHLNFKKWSETVSFLAFWLQNVLLATTACNFSTSELQKAVWDPEFFNILASTCASRHSGVQFFDIGTAKSGPELTCFVHFRLKMCFSPQRRAIFPHRNFKKCSENVSFFSILTSKCTSRHSGVQFLSSPLTTRLRTRRFNEPTFRLTRHTNHWKNIAFCDFSNSWRGWIFFLLTFALLHLLSSDSTLSSHSTSSICFSTLHIVGSLLFKLRSNHIVWYSIIQNHFTIGWDLVGMSPTSHTGAGYQYLLFDCIMWKYLIRIIYYTYILCCSNVLFPVLLLYNSEVHGWRFWF